MFDSFRGKRRRSPVADHKRRQAESAIQAASAAAAAEPAPLARWRQRHLESARALCRAGRYDEALGEVGKASVHADKAVPASIADRMQEIRARARLMRVCYGSKTQAGKPPKRKKPA